MPIGSVSTVPPAPFASPSELYGRIKKDLGLNSEDTTAQPLLDDLGLKQKVDALLAEYRKSTDAKRKQELKGLIKQAELDREARKHQENVNDYALRRKAFISDIVDALMAISVVNSSKDLRSIFRCNLDQMRAEFLDILKELPAKEVLPYLWQKLDEQVRFSGPAAEARVAQFDAEREKIKQQLANVRMKLNGRPPEPERSALQKEDEDLLGKLDQLSFDRMIASAGVNNRNSKFIAMAEAFIAGYGPGALDVLIPVLYGPNTAIKDRAGNLIRGAGLPAVPRLIEACERMPNEEALALLAAFAGKNLGRELKPYRDWWAETEAKLKKKAPAPPPAAGPAPNPEAKAPPQAAEKPPAVLEAPKPAVPVANAELEASAKPDPDEWLRKLREDLKGLREASERLRTARRRHAEAMLYSSALERQLEDYTRQRGEVKEADPAEAELRKTLAEALRREYGAKLDADKAQVELDALRKRVNTAE